MYGDVNDRTRLEETYVMSFMAINFDEALESSVVGIGGPIPGLTPLPPSLFRGAVVAGVVGLGLVVVVVVGVDDWVGVPPAVLKICIIQIVNSALRWNKQVLEQKT